MPSVMLPLIAVAAVYAVLVLDYKPTCTHNLVTIAAADGTCIGGR